MNVWQLVAMWVICDLAASAITILWQSDARSKDDRQRVYDNG